MTTPTGAPIPQGPAAIQGGGGVAAGTTPAGFGSTSVGTTPQPGGLPPGIDPQAVAANPQGYQDYLKGARQQAQSYDAGLNQYNPSSPEMQQQLSAQGGLSGSAVGGLQGTPEQLGLVGGGNQAPANPGLQGNQLSAAQAAQPPGGGGGPSAQASQMMQSMAAANALRNRQAQPMQAPDYTSQGQGA